MNAPLSDRLKRMARSLVHFLTSALFLNNLIALAGTSAFLLLFVMWWLRCYTHHGEKIPVDNYKDAEFVEAQKDARRKDFELVAEDSVFMVGRPGGMIITQNPEAGFAVKEGRRIYVTITKWQADQIPLNSLPPMYGQEVGGVQRALKQRFALESQVVREVFDDGPPGMVLMVLFEGDTLVDAKRKLGKGTIAKGSRLNLVISKDISESSPVPDLVCQTLSQAEFLVKAARLELGGIHLDDNVTNRASSWVYRQEPVPARGLVLAKGDSIQVWVTQARPYSCPDDAGLEIE